MIPKPTFRIIYIFIRFYLFLERREGREKERETSMCERDVDWLPLMCPQLGTWPATQHVPDWELNWRPFGSQVGTQSTSQG